MTRADWVAVIDQAVALDLSMVQFIGGEPTLHPDLTALIDHALFRRVEVEVFTNLVHVTAELWEAFSRPGVRLATSWYSDDPTQHVIITGRPSHARTTANIAAAVRRSIPLRVGIVGVVDGQRTHQAWRMLTDLGVIEVGYDDVRQVGRGVRDRQPSPQQLCGNCANGVLAISADGVVWPCVFSRWLPVGNVLEQPLAAILGGPRLAAARAGLAAAFAARPASLPGQSRACHPDCNPACQPTCSPRCSPSCNPCAPSTRCWPYYR